MGGSTPLASREEMLHGLDEVEEPVACTSDVDDLARLKEVRESYAEDALVTARLQCLFGGVRSRRGRIVAQQSALTEPVEYMMK